MKRIHKHKNVILSCAALVLLSVLFIFLPDILSAHYVSTGQASSEPLIAASSVQIETASSTPAVFVPSHVSTPAAVKGVYMTSWIASSQTLRNKVIKVIDASELNTVVIDIKDYSGKIVYPVTDPTLKAYGSEEIRVKDMKEFVDSLHKKGIYVVGRIAVFQDKYFVTHRPDLAVWNKAHTAVWKDRKGISWIDAGSKEYWDYIILLAKDSYNIGFDEINFDYIRFPSDGNMEDISFPHETTTSKPEALKDFFIYLHDQLKGTGMKTSADLFGMVTTAKTDMGIGQLLENTLSYFDYISPMVYPSHYPPNFEGFKEPEAHPYEVIKIAMGSAVDRAKAASTSPEKLRPWLQDFGLRMNYSAKDVRAQIKATYDVGLTSWLLWSASNTYTQGALEPK